MTVIAGIVVVAAAATLGDFIWYTVGVRHTMVAGLVHGALLLTAVGGALGAASGRPRQGASARNAGRSWRGFQLRRPHRRAGFAPIRPGDSRRLGDHVAPVSRP